MNDKSTDQLRVIIIGAGLSGLCLCNALLNDPKQRFKVDVYERDDLAYSSDRGGYQIRLGEDGITGLKECLDAETYEEMRSIWGNEISRAPTFVNKDTSILVDLNDLALYPKSRAVPRSALKDYLLRKPLKQGCVHLAKKLKDVKVERNGESHRSTVYCHFADGSQATGDILVAADGSGSLCNEIFGIRNLTKLDHISMQARGNISRETYEKLPATLKERGTMMLLTKEVRSFSAIYSLGPPVSKDVSSVVKQPAGADEFFLFWGLAVDEDTMVEIKALPTEEEKLNRMEKALLDMKCAPDGLPVLPRVGRQNVKVGFLGTSTPLEKASWRNNQIELGRVIFVGDSIHAMSPGRGQGANQAMKDAAELKKRMLEAACFQSRPSSATDEEIDALASQFDAEMYQRAFGWVKSSESAGSIDTSSWKGYLLLKGVTNAVWAAGLALSALQKVGLYHPKLVEF